MKRIFFPILLAFMTFSAYGQVVINELMASSDSLSNLPDEYGEYDDWVELYNTSSSNFDLGGYHISDDSSDPMKWTIPTGTNIPGNGFLIIWTDKDENNGQVPLHTNFKLSGDGETVLLSNSLGAYVDSIAYGEQTTNRAFARIPNGTGDFVDWVPSFGFSNDEVSNVKNLILNKFTIFPNPGTSILNVHFEEHPRSNITLEIINIHGQVFDRQVVTKNQASLDISSLAKGSYFLKFTEGKNSILRTFQKL